MNPNANRTPYDRSPLPESRSRIQDGDTVRYPTDGQIGLSIAVLPLGAEVSDPSEPPVEST